MFMPGRQNIDGSWHQMHARRYFCFAAIVSDPSFIQFFGNRAQSPTRQDERTEESCPELAAKE
jgi:hypothetical protein